MIIKYLKTILDPQVLKINMKQISIKSIIKFSIPISSRPAYLVHFQDQINEICGLTWSPNQQKLAVANADRTIILFDEHGDKRDKFAAKPGDPNTPKTGYIIRSICFSPDSTKLAVAQSDNIVFVYKLGVGWNEKKVICNKFPVTSPAIAITWLTVGPIIAGNCQYIFGALFFLLIFEIFLSQSRLRRWKSARIEYEIQ